MSTTRANIPTLTLALLLAVAPGAAHAQAAEARAAQDQRELQAYVLTMAVLEKVAKANRAAAAAAAKDPARQKLEKKEAELAALEAKDEITEADQARMEALAEEIARLEDAEGADAGADWGEAMTVAGLTRRIDATPAAAAAVRAVGLTSREYALASLALINAKLADTMIQQKLLKQAPPEVSQRNLEFVRAHAKEIDAMGVIASDGG